MRLRTRFWSITDAQGRTQEVSGTGVVGEQPLLRPGDSFEYTSGCPLPTPSGMMVGSYEMGSESGDRVAVAIPAFSLDSPHQRVRLNCSRRQPLTVPLAPRPSPGRKNNEKA